MAHNVADGDLFRYANRVNGQTVLITGGASGIGKATAFELAKRGARLVIGDVNAKAAEDLVDAIRRFGGTAIWKACDVLEYDDQRSLFEAALEEFGSVDVVIANAGISESEQLIKDTIDLNEKGLPMKPQIKTIHVNIISVTYTAQLAYFYFSKSTAEGSLKTLVLTASMLSFATLRSAPMYCSSKYAVLSLSGSLRSEFQASGFRIASVHPWFIDTPLVPPRTRAVLYGIPLSPIHRVVGAMVLAVTDAAPGMNGTAYTIPDEREVFLIPHTEINENVFALLSNRAKNTTGPLYGIFTVISFVKYFSGIRIPTLAVCGIAGCLAYVLKFRGVSYISRIFP